MIRSSDATWNGNLKDGKGTMRVGAGYYEGPYTYASRFESGEGTNPEELVGAAHAGCFSMFLASLLSKDGFVPDTVHTTAKVHLDAVDGAPTIHTIELFCEVDVQGVDADSLLTYAESAKAACPVSKALAAVSVISLEVKLVD